MARRISATALAKLKAWEGFRSRTYDDARPGYHFKPGDSAYGTLTIGYGHTGAEAYAGNDISEAEGEAILRNDLRRFESVVDRLVTVRLNDNQFGALVSFAFNVGTGAFQRSTLLRRLNAGDYDAVPGQLMRWNKARDKRTNKLVVVQGLNNRRAAEAGLWSTEAFVASAKAPAEPPHEVANAEVAGGGVGVAGGAGVLADGLTSVMSETERAGEAFATGDIIRIVIGAVILIGAGLMLYKMWNEAGRPVPWD